MFRLLHKLFHARFFLLPWPGELARLLLQELWVLARGSRVCALVVTTLLWLFSCVHELFATQKVRVISKAFLAG